MRSALVHILCVSWYNKHITWYKNAYLTCILAVTATRTNIKRPRAIIKLRLRTLGIDNKPQICIGEAV